MKLKHDNNSDLQESGCRFLKESTMLRFYSSRRAVSKHSLPAGDNYGGHTESNNSWSHFEM